MSNLFQQGDFTLASGAKSSWKIECDALTKEDWDGLAAMLMEILPIPFGKVVGVPQGGIPFADALSKYEMKVSKYDYTFATLVVDDVWTTGGSIRKFIKEEFGYTLPNPNFFTAVVFARNPVPIGVTALFTMPANRRI